MTDIERAARVCESHGCRFATLDDGINNPAWRPCGELDCDGCQLAAAIRALSPSPAPPASGGTKCLFCRRDLELYEIDDGSDIPPHAPGVCSECYARWHDAPILERRLAAPPASEETVEESEMLRQICDSLDAGRACLDSYGREGFDLRCRCNSYDFPRCPCCELVRLLPKARAFLARLAEKGARP